MRSQLADPTREQVIDRIRYADTLLESYMVQLKQIRATRAVAAAARGGLLNSTRTALSEDYAGFWDELERAVQLLLEAGVDVGHVRAMGSRREASYTGLPAPPSSGRTRLDRGQIGLARRALQALKDLFPAVAWQP